MKKINVVDVTTIVVVCIALLVVAQPGSAVRAPIEQEITDLQRRRAINKLWDSLVVVATPLGESTDAPAVFEFSDYECPFCRQVNPAVDSAIAAGARIAYVQYPLPIHVHAERAALVSICSQETGHFATVHHYFMTSDEWQKDTAWSRIPTLAPVMADAKFVACLNRPATKQKLHREIAIGDHLKLSGTPTFISHSELFVGAGKTSQLLQMAQPH